MISIVIRTKNESRHLHQVLAKIKEQSYKNYEIVIIDSGSKDQTLEIAKKFNAKIYEIPPKDFGYSSTLNYGIKKTNGQFTAILSGHSLPITKTWLEDGLKNFNDTKTVAVTGAALEMFLGYYSEYFARVLLVLTKKLYRKRDCFKNMTNTNSIIRKSAWSNYPFDESLDKEGCEDYDWACEMIARERNVVFDPDFSVIHSHFLNKRKSYVMRFLSWRKTLKKINQKKRPSKLSRYQSFRF